LITRFYGLHRVKMNKLKKHYFVVMGNIFPPHRDVHETYDLQGSTHGRYISTHELGSIELGTLKDLNWIERGRKLKLGPEKATLLINQLIADCSFLARMRIMDYSLLAGIHDMSKGNCDMVRDRSLMVYERIEENKNSLEEGVATKDAKNQSTFKPSIIKASAAGDCTGVPQE